MKTEICKRILSAVLALCLLGALCLLPVGAAADDILCVIDKGELLTIADEAALIAKLDGLSAEYGVDFYFCTYTADGYYDDYVGDDFCREVKDLRGEDAVLLIVTYDESDGRYYYDMYTYGRADAAIKNNEVNYILDDPNVYDNIKRGRLLEGVGAFFALSGTAYEGRLGVSFAVIIPICAAISLLIAFFVCRGVVAGYKRKKPSVDYPLDRFAKLKLTQESDRFETSAITRTYVPRNRSGGGGGGSSHGGGGGHRGGR